MRQGTVFKTVDRLYFRLRGMTWLDVCEKLNILADRAKSEGARAKLKMMSHIAYINARWEGR